MTNERDLVTQLFAAQVARAGDGVAVVCGDERLSYRELRRRARHLARLLRSSGVGPEVRVAIALERSVEMVVAVLAVLEAGGAYVPLDPAHPPRRRTFILEDSRTRLLLTDRPEQEGTPATVRVLPWRSLTPAPEMVATASPAAIAGGNLAYVIYTSGSTGQPKGVAMTHGALANLVAWQLASAGFIPGARVAQFAALGFDVSFQEMFSTWCSGGTLVLVPEELRTDMAAFNGLLSQSGVERVFLPVIALQHLAEAAVAQLRFPAALRQVITAGEALRITPAIETFFEQLPECRLHNHYGPSESHVVTAFDLPEAPSSWASLPPIGRPIASTQTHLADAGLASTATEGELLIGGVGVARGYVNRPRLTASRFVPDPFGGQAGARLYKTGDLARRCDGNLEFLGRIDHQVKVRGFRIELSEIEVTLGRHPGVRDAVVVARQDEGAPARLVAYVVASGEPPPGVDELRDFLRQTLPGYMVPAVFVELAGLPLLASGKVDRPALERMSVPEEVEDASQTPRTPAEATLARIYSEVLGREGIGIHDDFFELGGHSLLATQILSRLRSTFDVELSQRDFFAAPTVAELGRRLADARRPTQGVVPVPRDQALPLSFNQQWMWLAHRLRPDVPLYSTPFRIDFTGPLNTAWLAGSLSEIVRRHEALRTTFAVSASGGPVPVVAAASTLTLPVVDLSRLRAARRQAEAERLAAGEGGRPFDLEAGPLLRFTLLYVAAGEHQLLVNLHHIVSDDWSLANLVDEMRRLYEAFSAGRASPLPELAVQYADFAVWQRQRLVGDVLEGHLAYYRQQLSDSATMLELPADRPRPAVRSFRGAHHAFTLPETVSSRLNVLSRRRQATLFMTLLAAFKVLLYRYTGQRDILVASPMANRNRFELEGLIGCFINSVVVRTELEAESGFDHLLDRVRASALEAFDHQELPLEELIKEVHPERQASHNPLFQVTFALQDGFEPRPWLEERLTLSLSELDTGTAKLDLILFMRPSESGLAGMFEYSSDLFDATTIRRLALHFQALLEGVVARPERSVSALPLLRRSEHQQLLLEWNDTSTSYPREQCVHQLFESQVERTPDAVAVVLDRSGRAEGQLSYRELNAQANRLAHALRRLEVGPEVLVGLAIERSLEMMVGILGILKAGGAYLPIDIGYPEARLAFLLADARMPVVLTEESFADKLPGTVRVLCLKRDRDAIAGEREGNPGVAMTADGLSYVMYTSGTTGTPKGSAVPHRAVVRLVQETNYAELGAGEVFLQLAPISFDAATLEIWGPLLNGGRLVLYPPKPLSLGELAEVLGRHRITTLWLTAGLFHQMVESHVGSLAPLRQLLAGGDVLSPPHVSDVLERLDGCLVNGYGPTENTTFTCCYRMRPGELAPVPPGGAAELAASVPIGRPIANTRIYLVDAHLERVPIGVVGGLYAGGDGLSRGYFQRPALTARSFVPNPFSAQPGGRLYRTGDRARYLPDGNVEFLGRVDSQVKIRGFRIELGEIETLLGRHPAVKKVAVIARDDSPGGKRLVAYLVPHPRGEGGAGRRVSELRGFLEETLPGYMVPSVFVELDALPLNPNGKVDRPALGRRALPAPEVDRSGPAPEARNPVEATLAGIFSEVLGIDAIDRDDDLFDLGGHSLLATQVLSRVRAIFQVEPSLQSFFDHPTPAGLAKHIDAARRAARGLVAPPIVPVSRQEDLPLSYAEQRMWFLDQYQPGNTAYIISAPVRLRGALDVPALERSLSEVVRRQESLRTIFPPTAGQPRRVINPPGELKLGVVCLAGLTASRRESALRPLAAAELRRPFDLAAGPLLRVVLVRLDREDHLLLLAIHHIAADGWSMEILIREVTALYDVSGVQSRLPEPLVRTADFGHWQRHWLAGEVLAVQLAYWQEQLGENPPPLELPTDRPRPPQPTLAGARIDFAIADELAAALEALSRKEGATLFITLLAAYKALLARYAGVEEILVGSPVAGRNRAETEDLIGLFVNTLVFSTDLSGNPSFRELMARVRRVVLEASDHQDTPFDELVETLAKERDPSRQPLVQVLFDLQHSPFEGLRLKNLSVSLLDFGEDVAIMDMTLAIMESAGRLKGRMVYNTDLYDADTIQRLISHFKALLENVAADPGERLSELSVWQQVAKDPLLVTADERQAVREASPEKPTRETLLAQRQQQLSERRAGLSAAQKALLGKWMRRAEKPAKLARIPRRPADAAPELSFAQKRLWFLEELEPGTAQYNVPLAVRLEGPLDASALERSLDEVVRRHETLRTTFTSAEGDPRQVVASAVKIPLPVIDLRRLPTALGESTALRLGAEEARRPFDLEHGPVLRTTLLRIGGEDHTLLLSLHHICSDAWSMGVFLREVATLYKAFAAGRPSPLRELAIQYGDFAYYQRHKLTGKTLESHLDHWRRQLTPVPAALELPTDRRRPPRPSSRGAIRSFIFPESLAGSLEELGRRHGATLYMTLLATFMTLLHRVTGRRRFTVGSPIANRNSSESEGLIGFFVNTLVMHGDFQGDPSFDELLGRVKEMALGAYAHQDLPFEKLLEELQPERNRSQTPLVQVILALEDASPEVLELSEQGLAGLTLKPLATDSGTAKFDLSLFLRRESRGLAGDVEYATDLFDAATPIRLVRHFRTLLESIVARPGHRLSTLAILTRSERWQVTGEWNDTATSYPREQLIHQLFEQQAERTPEATAVVLGESGQSLSYRELNVRANRLAHALRRQGVGRSPEVLVGVALQRSLEMVVGILGILKAGGAYLPLDMGYPEARLAFLLADARVSVVLTEASFADQLPDTVQALCLDTERGVTADERQENPGVKAIAESLAYVMYTSGTTGTPKGSAVPHRAVVRLVRETNYAELGAGEVFLQLAPISFDASTLEIWGPLLNGGRLVLYPPRPLALGELGEILDRHRITTLWLTAGLFHQMVETHVECLAPLRQLLAGGDVLSPPHVRAVLEKLDGCLVNGYGPTENTTFTCCHRMAAPGIPTVSPGSVAELAATVPIGRPVANTRIYLLDACLEPVGVGVAGGLYTSGDGLSRGYLKRPALTAEAFVPDPFSVRPGGRLYRTGDLARYLPNGNVEFCGRVDSQVKIRGFRIEPEEIAASLGRHPAVQEVVVVARDDAPGGRGLVAYLVAHRQEGDGARHGPRELRAFVKKTLPEYMVPSAFVEMDALPLGPNGKVDRRALPAPDADRLDLGTAFVAPEGAVEEVLAGIWCEALGLERLSVEDDFFELGGHSLLATRLVSRVGKAFRTELPLGSLFESPSVAGTARFLVKNEARPGQTEKIARVLLKVRGMSAEDLRGALGKKRKAASADER